MPSWEWLLNYQNLSLPFYPALTTFWAEKKWGDDVKIPKAESVFQHAAVSLFMVHNPPGGLDPTQFESPTSPTPELEAAITTVFHNERNYYDILVL